MEGCSPKFQIGRSLMYIEPLRRMSAPIMHVRRNASGKLYKPEEIPQKESVITAGAPRVSLFIWVLTKKQKEAATHPFDE